MTHTSHDKLVTALLDGTNKDMDSPMTWRRFAFTVIWFVPLLLLTVRDALSSWPNAPAAIAILSVSSVAVMPAMGFLILIVIPRFTKSVRLSLRHWVRVGVAIVLLPPVFYLYAAAVIQVIRFL